MEIPLITWQQVNLVLRTDLTVTSSSHADLSPLPPPPPPQKTFGAALGSAGLPGNWR